MQRHKIKSPESDENKDLLGKIFDPDSNMSLKECDQKWWIDPFEMWNISD